MGSQIRDFHVLSVIQNRRATYVLRNEGFSRCSHCRGLYSLAAECVIICLTAIHMLATTIEILIHFDLIHAPGQEGANSLSQDATTPSSENTTAGGIFDPGGDDCDPTPKQESMATTVSIMRYITLAISALFFIEMLAKLFDRRKAFLKDIWQAFDLLVVIITLGVEIATYIEHDPLVCMHPATEVAGYIVIFRLWRIPRTCNIRKKQYARKLENDLVFLRKTKSDTDRKFKDLEETYKKQVMNLEKLYTICWEHSDIQIEVQKILRADEPDHIFNGNGPPRKSFGNAIEGAFKQNNSPKRSKENGAEKPFANGFLPGTDSKSQVTESPIPNGHTKKESRKENHKKAKSKIESDSKHNSVDEGETLNVPSIALGDGKLDSAIDEVFLDSDGSETPIHKGVTVQEVEVQIEEPTRQNQLPSISRSVLEEAEEVVMRRKREQAAGVVNEGYIKDEGPDVTDGQSTQEEFDGSKTYKSADGIPMTDL